MEEILPLRRLAYIRILRILFLFRIFITFQIFSEIRNLKKIIKKIRNSFKKYKSFNGEELVSIIVPTKNEGLFLPFLLKSLKRSLYKPIEVIIVDYYSSDDTVEIAKKFGATVLNAKKKGVGYASHIGVLKSQGDIIIRTDADAIFPPDLILNTVKYFNLNKQTKLYHIGHLYYDGNIIHNLIAHIYDKYWRQDYRTTGQFIAFKREFYEKVGGFNQNKFVGEDFDFGKRFIKKFNITYNPDGVILVSARRIKNTGFINYISGKRNWK